MIKVHKATRGMFADVCPLLREFHARRMSEDDWRRMLFEYPWQAESDDRGYVMMDGKAPVGFIGTMFSTRRIRGRSERFCHLSSWVVAASHRSHALELLSPVLRLTAHTLVLMTPADLTARLFRRLRHEDLDRTTLLLPPLASPREIAGLRGASVTTDPEAVRAALSGEERRCFDDHRGSVAGHLLVSRGERRCWVAATVLHKKRIPFALIQHLGDPDLFWECLPLVKWGFLRSLGTPGIAVDARFAAGARAPRLAWRASQARLYRPAHRDIRPEDVDGLYSEMMNLRL